MFSKINRLAKTKGVALVHSRGRSFFSPFFIVKFLLRKDEGKRFTVVVSTKVSKKAVVRNRLKRVVREYIRLHITKLAPGDYMFSVRVAAANKPAGELRHALEEVLV